MKKNIPSQNKVKNIKPKQARPENKDELDSRKNEEQDFKGDDVTHNRKDVRSEKKTTR